MKKLIAMILVSALLTICAACGGSNSKGNGQSENVKGDNAQNETENNLSDNENEDKLESILVEAEIDEVLSQAIVTVTNKGDMTFSGNVSVYFENSSGNSAGNDMIFVEDLTPGNYTFARIDIDDVYGITMTYNISSSEFTEAPSADNGVLDEDASNSLAEEFELSFGGAGNPEWATSWYKYVSKIEVYSGSTNYAVITVSAEADQESVDRIGNSIFGNFAKDFSLSRVLVNNDAGETLFDRAA